MHKSAARSPPEWVRVKLAAYELDQDFLEARLREDFGNWDFEVEFFNDQYQFGVPKGTTEGQLRALRKIRLNPVSLPDPSKTKYNMSPTDRAVSMFRSTGDPLTDFRQYIESTELEGRRLGRDSDTGQLALEKCNFVPYGAVKAYFRDPKKIKPLLKAIYGEYTFTLDAETIYASFLQAFSILLLIGRANLIRDFVANDIDDSQLPYRSLPEDFKLIEAADEEFWIAFDQHQWRLFPHQFRLEHIDIKVPDGNILPIRRVEDIDQTVGGAAKKISIHDNYHNLRSKGVGLSKQQDEDWNTFVLKISDCTSHENKTRYESEVYTLRQLGCNGLPNARRYPPAEIARYFGSFKQDTICCQLVEYANKGTLYDYLSTTPAPPGREDLVAFWKSLKALGVGIAKIHHLGPDKERGAGSFQGYHGGLNLTNVLVLADDPTSRYRVTFKIADLGLAKPFEDRRSRRQTWTDDVHATRTLISPETQRARDLEHDNTIGDRPNDVWSLACIFSIAATWTVGGWGHVRRFANYREQAREQLGKVVNDCFHDDDQVLEVLQWWHTMLVNDKAEYDDMTPKLWDSLLAPAFTNAASRSSAIKLQIAATALTQPKGVTRDRLEMTNTISDLTEIGSGILSTYGRNQLVEAVATYGAKPRDQFGNGTIGPHMSVAKLLALTEVRHSRTSRDVIMAPSVSDRALKERLTGRDHVFLFANSESMRPHWEEVCTLFGAMARFIKSCNPAGMEVHSTSENQYLRRSDTTPLIDFVKSLDKRPTTLPSPERSLRRIWDGYSDAVLNGRKEGFRRRRSGIELTIYIFTDGQWHNEGDMFATLSSISAFLHTHYRAKDQVGIQFILFGDAKKTRRFEDMSVRSQGLVYPRDLVDEEPADGNVWKMLLGSFEYSFDVAEQSTKDELREDIAGSVAIPVPLEFGSNPESTKSNLRKDSIGHNPQPSTLNDTRTDTAGSASLHNTIASESQRLPNLVQGVSARQEPSTHRLGKDRITPELFLPTLSSHNALQGAPVVPQDLNLLLESQNLSAIQQLVSEQRKLPPTARNKRIESYLTLGFEDFQIAEILTEAMDAVVPASDVDTNSQEPEKTVLAAEDVLAPVEHDVQEPEEAVSVKEDQIARGTTVATPDPGLELEPKVSPKSRRITWTCVCGVELFDDYIELVPGSLNVLEQRLRSRPPEQSSGGWWKSLWNTWSSTSGGSNHGSASGSSGVTLPAPSKSSPSGSSGTHDSWFKGRHAISNDPQSIALTGRNSTPVAASIQYLLLCLPTASAVPELHQQQLILEASHSTVCDDEQLFHLLRKVYYAQKRRLHSLFSLKRITRVSFTQFYVNLSHCVDVRPHHRFCGPNRDDCECMPPESLLIPPIAEYTCNPIKPRWRPPIGHNYLTHNFHEPGHSKGMTWVLNQVPKRTYGQLVPVSGSQPTVGWGLGLDDGWDLKKIIVMCQIMGLGTAAFAIIYSIVYKAAGDAFTISAFWVTLIGIFLGYVGMTQSGADLT